MRAHPTGAARSYHYQPKPYQSASLGVGTVEGSGLLHPNSLHVESPWKGEGASGWERSWISDAYSTVYIQKMRLTMNGKTEEVNMREGDRGRYALQRPERSRETLSSTTPLVQVHTSAACDRFEPGDRV